MTNLEALEKLYISLGGVESDLEGVNTTAEVIDLIKDVAEGGGSGGGALIVGSTTEGVIETLDHTWQEIYDVFLSGRNIYRDVPVFSESEPNNRSYDAMNNISIENNGTRFSVSFGSGFTYTANDPNGYPYVSWD